MKITSTLIGILISALLQTGVLAKIITDRADTLRSGQEVLVETGFVDPRDLFRGHYTVLHLEISRSSITTIAQDQNWNYGDDVFAELDTSTNFATVKSLWQNYPASPAGPVLKGTYRSKDHQTVRIDFPFDRFYADKKRLWTCRTCNGKGNLGLFFLFQTMAQL